MDMILNRPPPPPVYFIQHSKQTRVDDDDNFICTELSDMLTLLVSGYYVPMQTTPNGIEYSFELWYKSDTVTSNRKSNPKHDPLNRARLFPMLRWRMELNEPQNLTCELHLFTTFCRENLSSGDLISVEVLELISEKRGDVNGIRRTGHLNVNVKDTIFWVSSTIESCNWT